MKIITQYILVFLCLSTVMTSCDNSDSIKSEDILVRVGSNILTKTELVENIPYGLSENDSTKFARAYIRSWIDSRLVGEIASRNISDMPRIDQMVNEYRNELIMWEYRQRMYESHADKELSADSINAYYDRHINEFKTTSPLIKGIYIKVADNATNIKDLKKWYCSTRDKDIELLEKYGLNDAIHYDYFRDRWIQWEQVEAKIPYDFGSNPDTFIQSHKTVETSIGGFTYLLSISDYLPTGATMPLEVASQQIKDILINRNRIEYDRQLRRQLYDKGVQDGDIEILCDLES